MICSGLTKLFAQPTAMKVMTTTKTAVRDSGAADEGDKRFIDLGAGGLGDHRPVEDLGVDRGVHGVDILIEVVGARNDA